MIPFEDLGEANRPFAEEFRTSFEEVIASGRYILGERVRAFERRLALSLGAGEAVGVASGSDAIVLAFAALGAAGGEVILPAHGCPATALSVIRAGLTPVFAEPDPETLLLDPEDAARRITRRTVALLPVHLYGLVCDMDSLMDMARRHGLLVVEDCSQAHGSSFRGRPAGRFGHAAAFSFYPTKTLGALGDGGAVVTDDATVAERLRSLRNYGYSARDRADRVGLNSRLDELQAAFLQVKLARLPEIVRRKNALASRYDRGLDRGISRPVPVPGAVCARQHYVVLHPRRDELREHLRNAGIGTSIHYPYSPGRQEALAPFCRGEYPVTEALCASVLSLPLSFAHAEEDIDTVIEEMNRFSPGGPPGERSG